MSQVHTHVTFVTFVPYHEPYLTFCSVVFQSAYFQSVHIFPTCIFASLLETVCLPSLFASLPAWRKELCVMSELKLMTIISGIRYVESFVEQMLSQPRLEHLMRKIPVQCSSVIGHPACNALSDGTLTDFCFFLPIHPQKNTFSPHHKTFRQIFLDLYLPYV